MASFEVEFESETDDEQGFTIKAGVILGHKAQTYGPPEDCYPAEPDSIDWMEGYWANGFQMTDDELKKYATPYVISELFEMAHEADDSSRWLD